jgi:hypothetical protein
MTAFLQKDQNRARRQFMELNVPMRDRPGGDKEPPDVEKMATEQFSTLLCGEKGISYGLADVTRRFTKPFCFNIQF